MRCRLRRSSPIGFLLSGGLDSSSVVCVARSLLARDNGEKMLTLSGIYDEARGSDERSFVNVITSQDGVEAHYGHPDQLSPLSDWDSMTPHEDEPLWNPQMALRWSLYPLAKAENVHVVLDGFGGDGVISNGLAYLAELAVRGRWITLATEAAGVAKRHGFSTRRLIWKFGISPLIPRVARMTWRKMRGYDTMATFYSPIRHEYARSIGLTERISHFVSEENSHPRTSLQAHLLEMKSGIYPLAFEMIDRTGALFNIEPRHPFFDKRLVEFCLAMPPEQKIRGGWTRFVARRALENIVPDEVRWRDGKGDLS
ncbi:MAG: asparagine synthase-related protein, partial [Bacteroidota bacterium]